ncbi:hypothetical protein MHK_002414, partial [Candidatus Magnetomorum sp. HK-1]
NVSIKGKGENKTILNANGEKNVLYMRNVQHTKIDGITITNGSAEDGGGIYCFNSNPSLSNVTISGNSANDYGGGIYCSNSSPSLSNVTITRNSTNDNGGGIYCSFSSPSLSNVTITGNSTNDNGGGIYCSFSSPSLSNVTITGNSTNDNGGGIYCSFSSPSLSNVTISGNTANDYGGGICFFDSSPSLSNVTITGNTANDYGGGIYCYYKSSLSLSNVTITGNTANNDGGGIYCYNSSLFLVNSVLWHNSPQAIYTWGNSIITINYSNIENGFDGIVNTDSNNTIHWQGGNITTPPLFINPDDNFQLQPNSPCINSGHPDLDGDSISWENDPDDQDPDGSRMDMGSHYFPHNLTLTIPDQISEDQGILNGSIHSNYILTQNFLIKLTSSDPSLVSVPDTVIIPAGCTITTFDLNIINNQNYDKDKTVVISAKFWKEYTQIIRVLDDELWITIDYPENNASTDQLMLIYGETNDRLNDISGIQLQISDGNQCINENYEFVSTPTWIDAQGTNEWFLRTSKINWKKDTAHTITARAINTKGYTATTTITYINGNLYEPSIITCELAIDHIIAGEPIEIHGQISPPPKSGIPVDLELKHPESGAIIYPK